MSNLPISVPAANILCGVIITVQCGYYPLSQDDPSSIC
jgi:hypothetical protein